MNHLFLQDHFAILDISMVQGFGSFPPGLYTETFTFYDSQDNNIFTALVVVQRALIKKGLI